MMKLGVEDATAVDLLLNRTSMANNGNSGSGVFAAPISDSVAKRIGAVETLLRLVAEMPAEDPPRGLVQRTLDRINRVGGTRVSTATQAAAHQQPGIGHGPSHA